MVDRFLYSSSWADLFLNVVVHHLGCLGSDYAPLLLYSEAKTCSLTKKPHFFILQLSGLMRTVVMIWFIVGGV